METEFDKLVNRKGLATIRELTTPKEVDDAKLISLWGSEFEFPIPIFIRDGIKNWIDSGTISYSAIDNTFLELIKNWHNLNRNWEIEKEWIVSTYGHTHSVGTMVRAFTEEGDGIIGLTPTYHNTFKPAIYNGRKKVDCPLIFENNEYFINFKLLEQLMKEEKNKILAFCNPHNPIAKVWGREDLIKIAKLAYDNDVIIYSDEIFAECIYENVEMLTFSQVVDFDVKWIVGTSLGKCFSLTGVPQANMIIKNKNLREKFLEQRDKDHYGSLNPMIRASYFSAYTDLGNKWLKEMMKYCYKNYLWIDEYLKKELPMLKVIKPEGTYILWIDCRKLNLKNDDEYSEFFTNAKCICDVGTTYGGEVGFIRINLSLPLEEIKKVMYNLKEEIEKWKRQML